MEKAHKILFLDSDTLEVKDIAEISSPTKVTRDSVFHSSGSICGINMLFIVVEKDFNEKITREQIVKFHQDIAYTMLEEAFKNQQANLMAGSMDFDEYMEKEMNLKRLYFNVKQQVDKVEEPFELNLELNPE